MWLWRDWVIQAWNDNMPYDRFLVEQIAGDLLPDCTEGQRIAKGFQRNNMVTHEGGPFGRKFVNYNADRVKTMGEAILGLTLGCASATITSLFLSPIGNTTNYSPSTTRSVIVDWMAMEE